MGILFIIVLGGLLFFGGFLLSVIRGLGQWNRNYFRLSKRYGGKQSSGGVLYGYLLSNPSLLFDYGRTFCVLKNRKSFRYSASRQTELIMTWPDKRLKVEISTTPTGSRRWGFGALRQVEHEDPQFQTNFYVSSNQPLNAQKLLSRAVQWQLEQLRQLTGDRQLAVSLHRGSLSISKPGYLKDYQVLDDFVRLSLELFDHLMMTYSVGIEFLHEGEATIVTDVKCPICSEQIVLEMVICQRCRTPHCLDCWHYNGQCATFACSETRFDRVTGLTLTE